VKTLGYLLTMLFAAALCVGCGDEKKTEKPKTTAAAHEHLHWCKDCGFIEENGKCHCDDKTAKKCEKCGFHEGSPACCDAALVALKKGKEDHFVVCAECGELEDKCDCKNKDAKICPTCKKHEGSLYCRQHCGTKKGDGKEKPAGEKDAG
jgi:hypothetical protein